MTTPFVPRVRNEGFLLREDAALKAYLQGLRVWDNNAPDGGRPVPVYYRLPEDAARRRNYPYITIDLLTAVRDSSREHRGTYTFGEHEGYTPPGREPGYKSVTDYPIPMLLTYQVTYFARLIQHDRQILAAMLTRMLPERFGALEMTSGDGFDDDMSVRRMDVINGPISGDQADPADPHKRIFRKSWTLQVSSEIFLSDIRNGALVAPDKIFLDVEEL